MSLPASIGIAIGRRFGTPPRDIQLLGGSATGSTACCTIGNTRYFVKWLRPKRGHEAYPDPIAAEASGLTLLSQARAVRVPQVYLHVEAQGDAPACLVLEWIEPGARADRNAAGAALGSALAEQHRRTRPDFGLDQDNYCGATRQPNGWLPSWLDFYRERRLGFQLQRALARGLLPPLRRERLERLLERLDSWLDHRPEPPSLLHGDLWGGNWLIGRAGTPVIIDPAVYYGHREADLAMCHLFGGFPPSFFAAYDEAWPPLPGRDDRLLLYQLYHLLNHLNLFGEGYGAQVDQVLRRYTGK